MVDKNDLFLSNSLVEAIKNNLPEVAKERLAAGGNLYEQLDNGLKPYNFIKNGIESKNIENFLSFAYSYRKDLSQSYDSFKKEIMKEQCLDHALFYE